jgi:SAM-dependent methyltransferase
VDGRAQGLELGQDLGLADVTGVNDQVGLAQAPQAFVGNAAPALRQVGVGDEPDLHAAIFAPVPEGSMRRFWDERAREDALYFVDNRLAYGDVDPEAFWRGGESDLLKLLDLFGLEIGPGDTVLDIGCGVGRLTRPAASRARAVVALDVSEEMIERAKELNAGLGNVTWVLGDGRSLAGVDDGVVDGCVSLVVFQHVPDPQITLGYIEDIGRVLRPGGWAAIHVSNDPSAHRRRSGLRGRLRALTGRGPRGQDHPAWLGSAVQLTDAREAARRGGAEVEATVGEGTQFCALLIRRPR